MRDPDGDSRRDPGLGIRDSAASSASLRVLYPTEESLSTAETTFDVEGSLAILTFNRPQARNAMTWAMYEALVETCERVDADPRLAVLVLRGAGGTAVGAG